MIETPKDLGQSKPTPTWFFLREADNHTFACEEPEAWNLLHNRSNWMRRDFKMLGCSDGTTYFKTLREGAKELAEKRAERERLASDAARYRKTEDRLRFEELKGDEDEQVQKVKAILADLDAKLAALDAELTSWNRQIVDKAFKAELKKAKGKMVQPRNMDVLTPVEADRAKIIANLPQR